MADAETEMSTRERSLMESVTHLSDQLSLSAAHTLDLQTELAECRQQLSEARYVNDRLRRENAEDDNREES